MRHNTAIIVQARTGSTRLPNKMLAPFANNKTLLAFILDRLKEAFSTDQIIVATSESTEDEEICNIAHLSDVKYFQGDENNVLKRFIDTAKFHKIDKIIRVCADNPFISPHHIQLLINKIENSHKDYISFQYKDGTPSIKSHAGLFAEATTLKTLERVNELNHDKFYQEHVTNFIYENPTLFKIEFISVPDVLEQNKEIRLTIDTEEDFLTAKKLSEILPNSYSIEELVNAVINDKAILRSMQQQIRKNSK